MKINLKNKRGYTLIELMFVISISSVIFYTIMETPLELAETHSEYSNIQAKTYDLEVLRAAVKQDILKENIKAIDAENLKIGGATYSFNNGVSRNEKKIAEGEFSYELNEDILRIYNSSQEIKYAYGSSFKVVE